MEKRLTSAPWAEVYIGSGRPTGRLSASPVYTQSGEVAPGWVYVGDLTVAEYWEWYEWELHDECHSPSRPDWQCSHCQKAGWVE